MPAASLNLDIEQGTTFRKTLTWKAGTPAAPVDLTGSRARMQVRTKIGATLALLTLTTENGGIVLGGVTGVVTIHMSAEQTALLPVNVAVYSLRIIFADSTVKRLTAGSIHISAEATSE